MSETATPTPDGATDANGYVHRLRALRLWAGDPSLRDLARRTRLPHTTLADALDARRQRLPRLELVRALVEACGGSREQVARWERAWRDLRVAERRTPPTTEAAGTAPRPGAAPGGPVAPAQLPADLADFTGRADGVGKTSLAVHAAHALRHRYPDGQLYVNLRGASARPVPPAEVLGRFLRALGADPGPAPEAEDARAATFRSLVADRRVLIVLDDAADAAQVRPLLPGTPSCAVLVTSRDRLAALDGAGRIDLDVLPAGDARALFERIVGPAAVAAEPAPTDDVLRACAGLPLAIRIAGARLVAEPGWTIRALADRLADRSRVLDELRLDDRAVRTSLAVTHQRLSAEQARAFALLARWDGPDLGADAAGALLDRDRAATGDLLGALVGAHLLHSLAPGRYAFHDLVRAYAAEQPEPGAGAAVGRLATWHLLGAVAAAAYLQSRPLGLDLPDEVPGHPAPTFADREAGIAWLDAESANLVAGVECAARHGAGRAAWQTPVVLGIYFMFRASWADWSRACTAGLAVARDLGEHRGESRLLNGLGGVHLRQGRLAESAACLRDAAAVSHRIGDARGETSALTNLGSTYAALGELDQAQRALGAALDLSREVGDPYMEAAAGMSLAQVAMLLGDLCEAAALCERAAEVFLAAGNRRSYAMAVNNLGEVHMRAGDQPAARAAFDRAVRTHHELGNHHLEANSLVNLGNALCLHGQTPDGVDRWRQALELMERTDDPERAVLRAALENLTPRTRHLAG
ncbi:tetratricopeptide repeat protein [Longispora sp. K20-0274]|uniref:ATP-binding protein n=1 Tax=Longispora sp. K20-0274 TaxID=3088255 RepID=UPI00399B76E9